LIPDLIPLLPRCPQRRAARHPRPAIRASRSDASLSSNPFFIAATARPADRALLIGWQVHAETNRVKFPENFDQLSHCTTVRRGNVTEYMLTTSEAIDAIKNRKPTPRARILCWSTTGIANSTAISTWKKAKVSARSMTLAAPRPAIPVVLARQDRQPE
jgi:hypothetical protein